MFIKTGRFYIKTGRCIMSRNIIFVKTGRFYIKTGRWIMSGNPIFVKNRTMDNVQKHNICKKQDDG
jgi:Tfp pilus assembly protein PilZ